MRYLILIATLSLVLATVLFATPNSSAEGFGFSSEESGGSYLGVDTRDVTSDRLGALNLKEEKGVEVTMVDQDAPAGKAGVKEHDVILSLNGTEVQSVEQLRRMIHEVPPGRVVTLGVSRNGQPLTVKVQLADRKKSFSYSNSYSNNGEGYTVHVPPIPPIPPIPDIDVPISIVVVHSSRRSGLMLENLTPQLGDFFGAKNGEGVLVRSVEKGTPAEKAGFRAGDVIVKVNGERISDASDFSRTLQSRKGSTVSVGVIRDKKEQTLTLTIPNRRQSQMYEESFEAPQIDAETRKALLEAQNEIARAKPDMEMAAREMERMKPEMERAQRELARQQEQMKKDMRKLEEDLRKQQRHMQEKLRHELRGDWSEI
jgi:serine protease Do